MSDTKALIAQLREHADTLGRIAHVTSTPTHDSIAAAACAVTANLMEAHQEVKERPNQVCENYELCKHAVCQSSYTAFAISDKALDDAAVGLAKVLKEE